MVISIDSDGYVVVTSIVKIVIVFKVTKHVAVDPMASYFGTFASMSCRFASNVHGAGIYDRLPMVAIGSRDAVLVFEAKAGGHSELLKISKPEQFFNRENETFDPFHPITVPSISWGYGMSPLLKDRPHSMLAVAWGPVVQLAVLIDHEENDKPFILDGFYVVHSFDISQAKMLVEPVNRLSVLDFDSFKAYDTAFIEAIHFLSDSTLLILLSGQEIRILDT